MKELKILQVIDTLNVGGAERVFIDLTNLLYESGVSVSAMFLLKGGALQKELNRNIQKIEINRKKKFSFRSFLKTAKFIRQFHIIHCHFRHTYRYIKLIQRIFFIKTNIILQDHYGSIKIDKTIPLLLNGSLKPKYYIGVSRELNQWASTALGVPQSNIFLLDNVIRKQQVESIKGEKKSELVLVSNIKPIKNQQFIIDTLKELSVSLTIIGNIQDFEYYSELKAESGKDQNIEFLTDIQNIQPELKFYKLGLHTSKSETGPLVLIEYLAQGLPFLAYETGEVARILKPCFPQYFIDNFDKENWIERILFLLNEKPDRQKMDKVFNKHFGSRQYIEKCLKIYQSINN